MHDVRCSDQVAFSCLSCGSWIVYLALEAGLIIWSQPIGKKTGFNACSSFRAGESDFFKSLKKAEKLVEVADRKCRVVQAWLSQCTKDAVEPAVLAAEPRAQNTSESCLAILRLSGQHSSFSKSYPPLSIFLRQHLSRSR